MAERIYMVMGCKGGVGKTTVSKALVDTLLADRQKVLVIDADDGNPGLFLAYEKMHDDNPSGPCFVAPLDLSTVEGWSKLVNFLDEMPDFTAVVDTPAGNQGDFGLYWKVLQGALGELKREWQSVYVLSGRRDSVELLAHCHKMMPADHVIHIVTNQWFGNDDRVWANYRASKTKDAVDRRGGVTVAFPALPDHIFTPIDWDRYTYTGGLGHKDFKLGDRMVLETWLTEMRKELAKVVYETV
jgi:CobQ/CobB/MinD/ParA nucleotide binding domain